MLLFEAKSLWESTARLCWLRRVGISTEDSFNISLWLQAESFSERLSGYENASGAKVARNRTNIRTNFLFMFAARSNELSLLLFSLWKSRVRKLMDVPPRRWPSSLSAETPE